MPLIFFNKREEASKQSLLNKEGASKQSLLNKEEASKQSLLSKEGVSKQSLLKNGDLSKQSLLNTNSTTHKKREEKRGEDFFSSKFESEEEEKAFLIMVEKIRSIGQARANELNARNKEKLTAAGTSIGKEIRRCAYSLLTKHKYFNTLGGEALIERAEEIQSRFYTSYFCDRWLPYVGKWNDNKSGGTLQVV
jgi:hypothetical protein